MGHDIFSPHSPNSSRSSSVTIVTILQAERSGCSNPGTGKRSPISPKVSYRLWGRPSHLFNGYRSFSSGLKQPGVKLTTHLHLMPRLDAAEHLLHPFVFMAQTGKTLPFFIVMFLQFCVLLLPSDVTKVVTLLITINFK